MAYDPSKPFSYGIPDGNYTGRPTTASFYEKDGKLILDVKFAVVDPQTGEFYKNDKGYDWEANKRHWITNKDGGFNEATINGIREWAKGWDCTDLSAFYWFQQPDANGTPFGNLAAIGDVRLSFQVDPRTGAQNLWVHDPNRQAGRRAFAPDGAVTDQAAILAKWGAKARAVFAAQPRKVAGIAQKAENPAPAASATPAPAPTPVRPAAAPSPVPARPSADTAPAAQPWDGFPQTADGAFAFYCSKLGEAYQSAKHDAKWFEIFDAGSGGKDPDQIGPADVQRLFAAVEEAMK